MQTTALSRHIQAGFATSVVILAIVSSPSAMPRDSVVPTPTTAPDRALLDHYCVACHNDKLKTSGLSLQGLQFSDVGPNAEVWEKVLRKLRTGTMPPAGRQRPSEAETSPVVAWLEQSLDQLAKEHPNPGQTVVQRLNRTEYKNAIRDLLALDVNVAELLPPDDSGGGFDNIAEVLSFSPLLMEKYLTAARKVSRVAIGDRTLRDDIYRVPRLLVQDDRVDDELPLGTRGGTAIRHYFAADGEYLIRIKMQRNNVAEIKGLLRHYSVYVLIDGVRVKTFGLGGDKPEKDISELDATYTAMATYMTHADDAMEFRAHVTAGFHVVGATLNMPSAEVEGPLEKPVYPRSWDWYQGKVGLAGIGKVEIRGPYDAAGLGDTSSRRRIFVCRPNTSQQEAQCARRIIAGLARHAFRHPVTETDLKTLLEFYAAGRKEGGFERGIEFALQRILVSPFFVFRVEQDPPGILPNSPYRVSDLDLASRLSFFLWSSIPDDRLLNLAARHELSTPGVLLAEVRRMLADKKADALVSNFAGQWLGLRNLAFAAPNEDSFPEFDENLREAFRTETELFLESILREDRSVIDLLTADYTYVNERLAAFYGIPNVHGNWFRRVNLGPDQVRAGLLGQGSILAVTSIATRTSPVNRGKWILENILGTPPPPPPANVPALNEKSADGKALSMRQAMEAHRKNPVCATCHARMDPLGLALENFNAVGKWRETSEANEPIDAVGTLPNGTTFNGPIELRHVLTGRREQFVENLTEKLLMYATGRGMEYYDFPAIRAIAREAADHDYRMSSLIVGVIKSGQFQMRRSRDRGDVKTAPGH